MTKPTHYTKTILACYYQEIATGLSYSINDKARRNAAGAQFAKKEKNGTIDPETLDAAWGRYYRELMKEYSSFYDSVNKQHNDT